MQEISGVVVMALLFIVSLNRTVCEPAIVK